MASGPCSCGGKVAVVAGGAGLLGGAIARGLAAAGAIVHVADADADAGRRLAAGAGLKFVELDVRSPDSVAAALDAVVAADGRIDAFVYAAYPRTADWGLKLEEIPFASWNRNLEGQLGGFFLCGRAAAGHMSRQGGGSIVALASIYGLVAPDFSIYAGTPMTMPAAYAAVKGGMIAFARYLAAYYAPHRVRVNSVSPGGVFDEQPAAFVERYCRRTPLGRMASPEDIVAGVVYLASDASSYVTGHNLVIDGGWTAW